MLPDMILPAIRRHVIKKLPIKVKKFILKESMIYYQKLMLKINENLNIKGLTPNLVE